MRHARVDIHVTPNTHHSHIQISTFPSPMTSMVLLISSTTSMGSFDCDWTSRVYQSDASLESGIQVKEANDILIVRNRLWGNRFKLRMQNIEEHNINGLPIRSFIIRTSHGIGASSKVISESLETTNMLVISVLAWCWWNRLIITS